MKSRRALRSVSILCLLMSCLAMPQAFADGWMLREGRFPGPTTILRLTPSQVSEIERIVACRTDNTRTPYAFRLNRSQSRRLAALTGVYARRFAVFDSTQGDTGVDLPYNIVLRYTRDRVEVPHALLIDDRELLEYEREIIGWNPVPARCQPRSVGPQKAPSQRP